VVFIDDTVLVAPAAVGQIFPYTPFEETFATFTTDSPIVPAGGFVATDHTVLYHLWPLDVGLTQQALHRSRVRDDLRRIRKQAKCWLKTRSLNKLMFNYKFLILGF